MWERVFDPSGPSRARLRFRLSRFIHSPKEKLAELRSAWTGRRPIPTRFLLNHTSVVLSAGLDYYRRSIRQHFRDTLHYLGCIVAGADYRVSAQFGRVLQHQVESL